MSSSTDGYSSSLVDPLYYVQYKYISKHRAYKGPTRHSGQETVSCHMYYLAAGSWFWWQEKQPTRLPFCQTTDEFVCRGVDAETCTMSALGPYLWAYIILPNCDAPTILQLTLVAQLIRTDMRRISISDVNTLESFGTWASNCHVFNTV